MAAGGFWLFGPPTGHTDHSLDEEPILSASEVFLRFREASSSDDMDEFERRALEISERRLLSGLSPQELTDALGKCTILSKTYLDPSESDSGLFQLNRYFSKRADYCIYMLYEPRMDETAMFGLAIYKDELQWTFYERGRDEHAFKKVWTDYTTPPPVAFKPGGPES